MRGNNKETTWVYIMQKINWSLILAAALLSQRLISESSRKVPFIRDLLLLVGCYLLGVYLWVVSSGAIHVGLISESLSRLLFIVVAKWSHSLCVIRYKVSSESISVGNLLLRFYFSNSCGCYLLIFFSESNSDGRGFVRISKS